MMKETYIVPAANVISLRVSAAILNGSDNFNSGLEDPYQGDNWEM